LVFAIIVSSKIENISEKHYNKIRQSIIITIFKNFSGINQIIFMYEEKDVVLDVALKLRSRLESLGVDIKYENL
jgi:hypothetical protein